MNLSQQDIQALESRVPNIPENAALLAALDQMAAQASVDRQIYTYTNILAAAAGANALASGVASAPVNTAIQADAAFLWTATTYYATTANAAVTVSSTVSPNVTVLMVDTGSGRQLMDAAVPLTSIAGDGKFPYLLPLPRLIAPNSNLQCTYTNFDAAAGYNLFVSFHGFKIYKLQS